MIYAIIRELSQYLSNLTHFPILLGIIFIQVTFTEHKSGHFKVDNSVALSIFHTFYYHHLYLGSKHCHYPKVKPHTQPIKQLLSIPPYPSPWKQLICFSVSMD